MLNKYKNPKLVVFLALSGIIAGTALYGCSAQNNPAPAQGVAPTTQPAFALWGPPPHKSGVQLWSENCARCHNGRPPEEFSDAQWAAIVHHMRLRANLTGEEQREITAFLQASN
jgi:cytochrome c5